MSVNRIPTEFLIPPYFFEEPEPPPLPEAENNPEQVIDIDQQAAAQDQWQRLVDMDLERQAMHHLPPNAPLHNFNHPQALVELMHVFPEGLFQAAAPNCLARQALCSYGLLLLSMGLLIRSHIAGPQNEAFNNEAAYDLGFGLSFLCFACMGICDVTCYLLRDN